jgi:hypothetical protein
MSSSNDLEPPSKCAGCGAIETPGEDTGTKLKKCGSCKNVWYCSLECQRGHWKCHKQECKAAAASQRHGLSEEQLDKPVIVFFVERFVGSHMCQLLGSPDPKMWDILFKKKGAKERVHAHILSFALRYISSHPGYNSPDAIKRLLETKDHDTEKEPILSAMQEELWDYLKEKEHFLT